MYLNNEITGQLKRLLIKCRICSCDKTGHNNMRKNEAKNKTDINIYTEYKYVKYYVHITKNEAIQYHCFHTYSILFFSLNS